jgi:hypothetical protein
MPNSNDDLLWRIDELYERYSNEKSFWELIANEISLEFDEEFSKDRVRGLWRRSKANNDVYQKGNAASESKPDLVIDTDGISSVDELLSRSKVDLDTYEVDHFILNVWDGKEQVKVWLKRKVAEGFNQSEFLDLIEKVVSNHRPRQKQKIEKSSRGDGCLFIPVLFDAHIDSPKFNGNYINWLEKLIQMGVASGYNPTRIMFVIGNDFGHIDNQHSQTTAGTFVGATRTYLDSVDERCSIVLQACDLLRSYCDNLDVLVVPGNHDFFSSYWLGKVVESYYKEDDSISILNGQSPRKYYRYGKNLFGLTHGNEEKKFDLASLMAVESPIDWSMTENRVWLTGHLHQQNRMYNMLSEKFGVIQRIFPSLVPPDDWHILKGYIGNEQAGELLVYGKDGKIAEFQLVIR